MPLWSLFLTSFCLPSHHIICILFLGLLRICLLSYLILILLLVPSLIAISVLSNLVVCRLIATILIWITLIAKHVRALWNTHNVSMFDSLNLPFDIALLATEVFQSVVAPVFFRCYEGALAKTFRLVLHLLDNLGLLLRILRQQGLILSKASRLR